MNDKNLRSEELANKLFNKTITPEEEQELHSWYNKHLDDQVEIPHGFVSSEEEHKERILEAINVGIGKRKVVRLWPKVAAAVAVAVVIFGGGLFYFSNKQSKVENTVYASDILPGKVGATLTLASGRKIRLDDAANGEIAKEAGISVSKTADGQIVYEIKESSSDDDKINTLTTAKGETYILTLPDKSKIWMNAASTLTYSASLIKNGTRRIKLEGEAYFQIAKDKAHPFIVESRGQEVEVLGTHFNINSYDDEPFVTTTLEEGSVKVGNSLTSKVLKPGQQSTVRQENISVKTVDVENVVAWKNGAFLFEEETLGSIMRKVARWYNVDVIYKDVDQNELYGGGVSRYDKVSKVLENLELTGGIHFKIEGRTITVMK